MRKTVLFVLVASMLLLSPAVLGQNKPEEPPSSSPPAAGRRLDNLSPEEQAKLKEKWQSMSAEDKAKIRDKIRERVAGPAQSTQGQRRKEIVAEMARLQEQHKASVAELQAIKQLAVKENAKETAAALTQLIAKHQRQYDLQMQVLQRRLKLLQGEEKAKSGAEKQTQPGGPPQPDEKAPKVEPKQ